MLLQLGTNFIFLRFLLILCAWSVEIVSESLTNTHLWIVHWLLLVLCFAPLEVGKVYL